MKKRIMSILLCVSMLANILQLNIVANEKPTVAAGGGETETFEIENVEEEGKIKNISKEKDDTLGFLLEEQKLFEYSGSSSVSNTRLVENDEYPEYVETEPNDSAATSDLICENMCLCTGVVSGTDLDYYKFTISETAELQMRIISVNYSLMYGIEDSKGDVIYAGYFAPYTYDGDVRYESHCNKILSPGTYYIYFLDGKMDYTVYGWALVLNNQLHSHSYNSEITVKPTCISTGTRTYTCSCGDNYTETIPSLGHSYSMGYCTRCGTEDPIYHTHSYTEKVTTVATCTRNGVITWI